MTTAHSSELPRPGAPATWPWIAGALSIASRIVLQSQRREATSIFVKTHLHGTPTDAPLRLPDLNHERSR